MKRNNYKRIFVEHALCIISMIFILLCSTTVNANQLYMELNAGQASTGIKLDKFYSDNDNITPKNENKKLYYTLGVGFLFKEDKRFYWGVEVNYAVGPTEKTTYQQTYNPSSLEIKNIDINGLAVARYRISYMFTIVAKLGVAMSQGEVKQTVNGQTTKTNKIEGFSPIAYIGGQYHFTQNIAFNLFFSKKMGQTAKNQAEIVKWYPLSEQNVNPLSVAAYGLGVTYYF